ncbi:hypothetical protein EV122DRAFT_215025 [Schizophyllum commune]
MVAINARSSALAVSLVLATLASVDALPVQKDISSSPQKQSSRSANALKKVSSRSRFLRREPMVITEELHGPVHQQASFSILKRDEGLAARDHDHDHDHDHEYIHEHDHDHDRHHEHDHDHDHDRDHDHHHRRSIAIPNGHGTPYIVAHQARSAGKREQQGVPGFINIMSDQKKLGSLILDTSNSSHYVLDASEKNSTEMYLVSAGSGSGSEQYFVQIPLIDMQTASVVPYCATYDPNPPQAEPLTVEKCDNSTPAQTHKSQYFAFDKETGVIHPMWYSDKDSTDDNTAAAKAVDGSDAPEGSDIASVTSDSDLTSRDDSAPNMTAQSVTLVFTPTGTQVENVDDVTSSSVPSTVSTSTASTATVSQTAISSAVSLTAADVSSSSSLASSAASSAISRSTSATSSDPSPTAAALDVEVVPNRASSSSVTSSAATSSAVTSSVAASSAHSLDAEAVASSIAASSSAASSTTVSSTDASLSAAAASTSTAASSSMTPVTSATAPYQWMFKENTRL